MKIEVISVGPYEVNCYILWTDGHDALVVDPGFDADRIDDVLSRHGLGVCVYLITHGHVDHICALAELHAKHPAPIAAHPIDAKWMFNEQNQLPPYYPAPTQPDATIRLVDENENLNYGGLTFRAIATPGHSPGGVCYYFPEQGELFSGDTLFQGSVGRTDLPGGSAKNLSLSLRRLAALPNETRVHPGHGPSSTIEMEKKRNYFLRGMDQ